MSDSYAEARTNSVTTKPPETPILGLHNQLAASIQEAHGYLERLEVAIGGSAAAQRPTPQPAELRPNPGLHADAAEVADNARRLLQRLETLTGRVGC